MLRHWVFLLIIPLLLAACASQQKSFAPGGEQGPALIMFYTDNWLPWQEMKPIVDGLEKEFADALTVMRLDADVEENARLQQTYGLRGHPTFTVLDVDGRVVQTFTGPQTEEALYEAITAVIVSIDWDLITAIAC